MTELQYQLAEIVVRLQNAKHSSDEWLELGREHSRILNERQKEMMQERHVNQFERVPDEGLL